MKKTVIEMTTKTGRQYNNFQTAPQSADPKKQKKFNEEALAQAEYEAHCLLQAQIWILRQFIVLRVISLKKIFLKGFALQNEATD